MRRLGGKCPYESPLDEIIPASNVFGCLIVDSFQGRRDNVCFYFLLLSVSLPCSSAAAFCDEAGLPALMGFWIPA